MENKTTKPADEFKKAVQTLEPQFKAALPKHIDVEKFMRVVNTAVGNNPKLLEMDRQSLYGSCMRAAQDGLLPDGREAAIVQFKGKAQYMPMVAGILKKVRNSGELESITSLVIHKNDRFKYWIDSKGEHLEHEPLFWGERGEVIGAHAVARTKDGGVYIEVMTETQIQAVAKVSASGNSGPWGGPFADEMRRKTVIRRLAKRLPMSTDIEQTLRADDELFEHESQQPAQTETVTVVQRTSESPKPAKSSIERLVEAHGITDITTEPATTPEPETIPI